MQDVQDLGTALSLCAVVHPCLGHSRLRMSHLGIRCRRSRRNACSTENNVTGGGRHPFSQSLIPKPRKSLCDAMPCQLHSGGCPSRGGEGEQNEPKIFQGQDADESLCYALPAWHIKFEHVLVFLGVSWHSAYGVLIWNRNVPRYGNLASPQGSAAPVTGKAKIFRDPEAGI